MSIALAVMRLCGAHWALAPVCALFLLMGAMVLDDYGITVDEARQRQIGNAALDRLGGDGERAFDQLANASDRYYGAIIEAPLILLERLLGVNDSRDIFLGRHLFTHLFFLVSGLFCYALVFRMFNNKLLALIAMILFLLHPRIYAHSFFNSKDVPFLGMFMVSLFLVDRACRRNTLAAFLLCGVGVGLLMNIRIMGLSLLGAVLALRALDMWAAGSAEERRRALLTGTAFALAAALTFHASLPALWADPPRQFAALLRTLGSHPLEYHNLFRGELLYSPDGPPLEYVPVWVAITTPPATLLLALAGAMALARRGFRRPRNILRNTSLRFGVLLLALPIVTVLGIVGLGNNVYTGWRQLYFLYAPLLLLAVLGLHALASPHHGRRVRAGTYAAAVTAVAVAVVSMVRIHPFEDSHFTSLTDRTTPGQLASRYNVNYLRQSTRDVVGNIVDDHPSGILFVDIPRARNRWVLPAEERSRLTDTNDFRSGENNFHEIRARWLCPVPAPASAYVSRLYSATLHCVVDPVAWFGDLRQRALSTEPLERSRFDAYRLGGVVVYVRDGCSPEDIQTRFFFRVHPINPADLPPRRQGGFQHRRGYAFEKLDFNFGDRGARIDGNCVAAIPLPAYPIARIDTGQFAPGQAEAVWRAVADAAPRARSHFDIHFDPAGHSLIYVRARCSTEDVDARIFLHVYPADERSIPDWRTEYGFDNHNFSLREYGARTDDGRCIATVPLPAYAIATIHTGQNDGSGGRWQAEFALAGGG